MATNQAAYVLPEDAVSTTEAQTFPGFPGSWTPGVAVACSDLGLTAGEAADLVKELGIPLKKTTAAPTRADGDTSMISSASVPSTGSVVLERSVSPMPGLSADEFDAALAEEPASPVIKALAANPDAAPAPQAPADAADAGSGG